MELLKQLTRLDEAQTFDKSTDITKLIQYYRPMRSKLSANTLRDKITYDLEQLEYSPKEINTLLPKIIKQLFTS